MILANGETLLREWTYATKKEGNEKSNCTLSITDKRIVSSETSNRHVSQQEIYTKDVKTVAFNHSINSKLGAILCIIFGIVLFLVGALLALKGDAKTGMQLAMLLPFFILGFIFLCVGIHLLSQRAFTMIITTEGEEGSSLSIGAWRLLGGRKRAKKVKVKVVDTIVLEIIDELGALILNSNKN